ncbi:MAG: hypothetical protein WA777_08985 [Rhodanobacter sp.]
MINDKTGKVELMIDESGRDIKNLNEYGYTRLWVNRRDVARRELLNDALNDASKRLFKVLAIQYRDAHDVDGTLHAGQ